jgi:hypothetical protein
VFLSSATQTSVYILCCWTQLHKTFTDLSTHLGNVFVAVDNAQPSNKMAVVHDGSKSVCYYKFSILLVMLLLLPTDNIVERRKSSFRATPSRDTFCQVDRHRKSLRRDVKAEHLLARKFLSVQGTRQCPRKVCDISTTDRSLKQHCMENLSCRLVASAQNAAESASAGGRNSSDIRGHFQCFECRAVFRWRSLPFGCLQ